MSTSIYHKKRMKEIKPFTDMVMKSLVLERKRTDKSKTQIMLDLIDPMYFLLRANPFKEKRERFRGDITEQTKADLSYLISNIIALLAKPGMLDKLPQNLQAEASTYLMHLLEFIEHIDWISNLDTAMDLYGLYAYEGEHIQELKSDIEMEYTRLCNEEQKTI